MLQVRSQAEARKTEAWASTSYGPRCDSEALTLLLANNKGTHRPACASAQSDLRLCYPLFNSKVPLILHVLDRLVGCNMINPLATPLGSSVSTLVMGITSWFNFGVCTIFFHIVRVVPQ